jgi:cytochrome oxidase Cu insertion factor (SCO1/SenC/PrrC family)
MVHPGMVEVSVEVDLERNVATVHIKFQILLFYENKYRASWGLYIVRDGDKYYLVTEDGEVLDELTPSEAAEYIAEDLKRFYYEEVASRI